MRKIKIGITILILMMMGGLALGIAALANSSSKAGGSNNEGTDYAAGQMIVKFQGDTEPFRVIKVPKGKVMEKVKEYQGKANVIYAEPNYFLYAFENSYYNNQWALHNTGQDIYNKQVLDCIEGGGLIENCCAVDGAICKFNGSSDADIDWNESSDIVISGGAVIAILDTGIDETHPDLKGKLIAGKNFTKDGDADHTQDIYGHGTHVAGIAAAETNNGIGVVGVAFPANIKIMPVKVLGDDGCSDTGSVANGIKYAADNGANVINLSLGGRGSETLKNAVNDAWDKGVLIAAAAGNDGGGRKRYPASYSNVMSVAATNYNDNAASFSNFNDEIDISAPGVNVFSTFPTYKFVLETKYGRSQDYDLGSGTSMAVPHIVGLAGLLFAQDDTRTNVQVRTIIEETADDLGTEGWDRHFGWGRINVYNALSYSPCSSDTDCDLREICCSGECVIPTCTESGGECDDGEGCTTDTCVSPNPCLAYCENTWRDCDLSIKDGCCGPECNSDTDIDCDPCSSCFKGVCDGKCNPVKEDTTCPDCL